MNRLSHAGSGLDQMQQCVALFPDPLLQLFNSATLLKKLLCDLQGSQDCERLGVGRAGLLLQLLDATVPRRQPFRAWRARPRRPAARIAARQSVRLLAFFIWRCPCAGPGFQVGEAACPASACEARPSEGQDDPVLETDVHEPDAHATNTRDFADPANLAAQFAGAATATGYQSRHAPVSPVGVQVVGAEKNTPSGLKSVTKPSMVRRSLT
jgi:hypothetical protein